MGNDFTNNNQICINSTKSRYHGEGGVFSLFALIKNKPFEVTSVTKKKGTEQPKQLYDLTSLQVEL